jgi:hypothetical protein
MKFSGSVDLNIPIEKAVALFNDPRHFKEWQEGFVSYETISGMPRTAGAKSKVTFMYGKRKMVLTETIQVMNLPVELTALYEHEHMVNSLIHSFAQLPDGQTRYTAAVGYTRFIGFLPKLMSLLFSGMYKKQNQKWLDAFKAFAERSPN